MPPTLWQTSHEISKSTVGPDGFTRRVFSGTAAQRQTSRDQRLVLGRLEAIRGTAAWFLCSPTVNFIRPGFATLSSWIDRWSGIVRRRLAPRRGRSARCGTGSQPAPGVWPFRGQVVAPAFRLLDPNGQPALSPDGGYVQVRPDTDGDDRPNHGRSRQTPDPAAVATGLGQRGYLLRSSSPPNALQESTALPPPPGSPVAQGLYRSFDVANEATPRVSGRCGPRETRLPLLEPRRYPLLCQSRPCRD